MNEQTTDPTEEPEAPAEKGAKIASFDGSIVLYDQPGNVSRANREIVTPDLTIDAASEIIERAFTAQGYTASVRLTRSDR